jgi:IS30 family transposase
VDYVKSCTSCARSKAKRHKPYGLLHQLPILLHLWESISMDFIKQLPDSKGFTTILVVVDCFTKQALFIPTHDTITSAQLAELFIIHVFSKHGVSSHVTSDQGSEFVSCFFHSLGKALNIKLHFTLGYHPEGDGQTERINQTLEQYLRIYCNFQQDNWHTLLPIAEFCYNNTPSSTTGVSSFFANKGYNPALSFIPNMNLLL